MKNEKWKKWKIKLKMKLYNWVILSPTQTTEIFVPTVHPQGSFWFGGCVVHCGPFVVV